MRVWVCVLLWFSVCVVCVTHIWGVPSIDMIYPNPIADYDRVPYKLLSGTKWRLSFYWLTLLATGLKGKERSVATVTKPVGKILGEGGLFSYPQQISSYTAIYIQILRHMGCSVTRIPTAFLIYSYINAYKYTQIYPPFSPLVSISKKKGGY